jgi:hypothetical protein
LLHFLALFVATFGGVTAMVDNIREMFGPATWRGSQIATTNFAEFPFHALRWIRARRRPRLLHPGPLRS